MRLEFIIVGIIIVFYVIYMLYFKDYWHVRRIFLSLRKFLNMRDTFVLKIVPEIKDKKLSEKIVTFIEERKLNFNSSYNNAIKSDVKLNSELKNFYQVLSDTKLNELTKQIFEKTLEMEKELKNMRNAYNQAVEKYNENLIKHKFITLKIIRMKPLDTYKRKNESKN